MSTQYNYAGKVALVTGGGSGIGRATAIRLAAAGTAVVIGDIDDAGADVRDEIVQNGGRAVFEPVDVADAAMCTALIKAAVSQFGGLDMAFNNAGIIGDAATIGVSARRDWDRMIAINLSGVFNCMQAQIAVMTERGGSIVNNASVMGLLGAPSFAGYSASKHGVIGLTRSAAAEYGRTGIRINAICPGFIRTPMTEFEDEHAAKAIERSVRRTALGRLGNPDEIADVVLWLCSDGASYVTGVALPVDGGFTIS